MVFLECNCKTVSVSPTQSMLVVMVEEGSYRSSDQKVQRYLSYLRGVRPCSTSKTSKLYMTLQHIIRRYSLIVTFHLVLESCFQPKSTTSFALEKKMRKQRNKKELSLSRKVTWLQPSSFFLQSFSVPPLTAVCCQILLVDFGTLTLLICERLCCQAVKVDMCLLFSQAMTRQKVSLHQTMIKLYCL